MTSRSDEVARAAEVLSRGGRPRLALVLGSGLGGLTDLLDVHDTLAFDEVPGLPPAKVAGHAGAFVFGRLGAIEVVAQRGRVHAYEGHAAATTVLGVRAMRAIGAETFVLTNAAGGIRDDLEPGDVMGIDDHLNLSGLDPGVGDDEGPLGPRFVDLVDAWDPALRLALAMRFPDRLRHGVYAGRLGPSYETPAEVRMLAALGADAVGMSTVLEAIALRRMGARLVGLSCITNRAAGRAGAVLDHADVQMHAARAVGFVGELVRAIAEEMR